jgi:PAS domain S-box-containing protein
MARMYGLERAEDLVGKTFDFMLPLNDPVAREFVVSIIQAGYRASDVESAERNVHGEPVYFSNSMVGVVENGRLHRIWGTQRDITARKRVEEAMRELSERFQTMADNIPALAWMANPDGWIFWFNKRWYDYTGTKWEEMQNWGWKKVHHPDHVERVVSGWNEHLREGTTWEDTFPLRRGDGEYRWFLSRARPIRDAEGRIVRWFGTNTDVTDLREAQRQLSEANEQLSSRARQLNAMVEKRTAELRETVQQLETFSYSIVHDMRAPLRSVRSFAKILQDEYREKLDEVGQSYLARIMASASRMDSLITDVLKYSQLASNQMSFSRVDLDRLVTEIVEQYPQFQEAAAAIHIKHPLPEARGNTALLTQVVSNLIGNALKFVPRDRTPHVTVGGEGNGGTVRLWVEDNGIGIPPGQREKIFGLFQRLHHPEQYPGTGVGLAIVKKAVERMHGKVGVESEPGRGSRFWVELPKPEEELMEKE